jgi:nucleotide-binding universal stress UspA family protein
MARHKVLIPVDGSEASLRILPHVRKFLRPEETELILFRVGAETEGWSEGPDRPVALDFDGSIYPSGGGPRPVHRIYATQEEESRRTALEDELQEALKLLREDGYEVSVEVCFGTPAEEIRSFAGSHEVDLIAMTTHGRTGLKRLLAGSVAEEIVREVGLPILLLRPFRKE